MDAIKKRIQDLERENQDLNNYITLVNKNLESQQKQDTPKKQHNPEQEEIIDQQLRKIEGLCEEVGRLESERDHLHAKIQTFEGQMRSNGDYSGQSSDGNRLGALISERQLVDFKLLEEKFKRVMQQNADLNDKNQQLEHIVVQLQCETETIGNWDYF